jgi:hypothetical protein
MNRNIHFVIALACLLSFLFAESLSAEEKDFCGTAGMIIRNMTMNDLWYKKNGGACTIWIHEHVFTVRPEDDMEIFSDLICKKKYCNNNPTYEDYKSKDANGDCAVGIFPYCNLSDM